MCIKKELILYSIRADYNSSLDFSVVDKNDIKINPEFVRMSILEGKLAFVELVIIQDNAVKRSFNISLPPEKVEVYFNYQDKHVLNHRATSEFSSPLGIPKVFNIDFHLPPDSKEEIRMHIEL